MDKNLKNILDLINCTRYALNNDKTIFWNKEGLFADCKYLVYLVVLYLNELDPIYTDKSFTRFRLNIIAKRQLLDYDKTKTAEKIYTCLIKQKEVTAKKQENKTYLSITKKGMDLCEDRLEFLCEIIQNLKSLSQNGEISKGAYPINVPNGILRRISKISREI